jgi:hypothetical protein
LASELQSIEMPTATAQPIMLIGAARSGTKFLRDMLAASPRVKEIPFDVNFLWRFGNESHGDDAIPASAASPRVVQFLRQRLPRLASAAPGDCLLEKSVSNALRVPFVHRVFPEAKWIHLIRDGKSVVESVCRVWEEPSSWSYRLKKLRYFPITNVRYAAWLLGNAIPFCKKQSFWGPRYPGFQNDLGSIDRLEVCAHQWVHCVQHAMRDLQSMDREDVFEVRYERLLHDPETLERLCRFIGIDPRPVMERFEREVRRDTESKWRVAWSAAEREKLQAIMGDLLSRLGYDPVA